MPKPRHANLSSRYGNLRVDPTLGQRVGAFQFKGAHPGKPEVTLRINPADWGGTPLARALAHAWERHARSSGALGTATAPHALLTKRFFPFLTDRGISRPKDLSADDLLAFEKVFPDAAPRNVAALGAVWAYLKQIDGLPPETRRLVSRPPAVAFPKSEPIEALTKSTMGQVVRAAKSDVSQARTQFDGLLTFKQTIAYYILLLIELGWSVDVLRGLSMGTDPVIGVVRWPTADEPDTIEARWFKKRARTSGREPYHASGRFSAGALLKDLRDFTSEVRSSGALAGLGEHSQTPWICRAEPGIPTHPAIARSDVALAHVSDAFRRWLKAHQIEAVDINGEPLERIRFGAVRVAAKSGRKRVSETEGLMSADLVEGHSLNTFHSQYQNDPEHMQEVGDILMTIAATAEDFARLGGHELPRLLMDDGRIVGEPIAPEIVEAALSGESDYGLAACIDPENSPIPGNHPGTECADAFSACFGCPNAIVTPRFGPRMAHYVEATDRLRESVPPPEWQAKYAKGNAFCRLALEYFGDSVSLEDIAGLLDLGLRGGPQ